MRDLWSKNFIAEDITDTAQSIILEQCDTLEQRTKGKILAKVIEYYGPIKTYTTQGSFSALAEASKMLGEQKVDIQDSLGEIENSKFTYEFYLTSIATPNYKYRVLFIEYGITFYPVSMTIDESIALEISEDQYIECQTQNVFEEKLEKILNSNKLEKVINNLLAIVKKSEDINKIF